MLPTILVSPITRRSSVGRRLWILLLLILSAVATAEPLINDDKPFAAAHIILQLSDADAARQSAVLDVANNLIKHYGGPDLVDIEIVAFGPGIKLYERSGPLAPRIASLLSNEVRFVVCKNTLDTLERTQGRAPELVDGLIYVQTGVAYMVERVQQGYTLVRP